MMINKTLIVIPAAGFGTRMNLEPHQSKEMLPDPYNDNKPLIDWHLDNVDPYETVIVTRKEKKDLIKHIANKNFAWMTIKGDQEWPATILATSHHWRDSNIVLLPDTRFEPKNILAEIDKELETHDLVFAVHEVDDLYKWGWVNTDSESKLALGTQEKPIYYQTKYIFNPNLAWGIIGFRYTVGENLFQAYLDKTYFDLNPYKVKILFLDKFMDITRTGKIENYL